MALAIVIQTPRLVLRSLESSDARPLAGQANDPRIADQLRDGFPHPYSLLDARTFIDGAGDRHPLGGLAVTVDGRLIGVIGLLPGVDVARFSAEVGYWLGVDHWGKGYASEALAAFAQHVFTTTDFARLFATVYSANVASSRVLQNAGFTLESLERHGAFKAGSFRDVFVYARLRDDPGASPESIRITTPRLVIRSLTMDDAPAFAAQADDPRIAMNMVDGFPSPYTLEAAQRTIAATRRRHPLWYLAITTNDALIGCIGMNEGEGNLARFCEIGYWFGVNHWGRGYATEAVEVFTDHLFSSTDIARIQAGVFAGHRASGRVLEKAGYVLESVARQGVLKNGALRDTEIYVRLKDDPPG